MLEWAAASGITEVTLGCDANETVYGPIDRAVGRTRRPGRPHSGTIHGMLLEDGWVDLFRLLHPFPDPEDEAITDDALALDPGHTYFDPGGGSSRIDYVLSTSNRLPLTCSVDSSFHIGNDTGHRPLLFQVDLASPAESAPPAAPVQDRVRERRR